jgi:hypothetical protein
MGMELISSYLPIFTRMKNSSWCVFLQLEDLVIELVFFQR